jgi:hypothetical protein
MSAGRRSKRERRRATDAQVLEDAERLMSDLSRT